MDIELDDSFAKMLSVTEEVIEDNNVEKVTEENPEQTPEATNEDDDDSEYVFDSNLGGYVKKPNNDEDDTTENPNKTEPSKVKLNKSVYSSLASALLEEGILGGVSDEELDIKDSNDFLALIENTVNKRLSEKQQRIESLLNNGAEPTEVQRLEQASQYLESISEDSINDESEQGEALRKSLLFQDYINRGYSEEKALKEVDKTIKAGTDIEDAKDALNSLKEFVAKSYEDYEKSLTANKEKQEAEIKERVEKTQKIIKEGSFATSLELDKKVLDKAIRFATHPAYRDEATGKQLTELQYAQLKNPEDFAANVSIIYALTNGFKDLSKIINVPAAKKQEKKALKQLEETLRTPSRLNTKMHLANMPEENEVYTKFDLNNLQIIR